MTSLTDLQELGKIQKDYRKKLRGVPFRFNRIKGESQTFVVGNKSDTYCEITYRLYENNVEVLYLNNNGTVYSSEYHMKENLIYAIKYLVEVVLESECNGILIPKNSIYFIDTTEKYIIPSMGFIETEEAFYLDIIDGVYLQKERIRSTIGKVFTNIMNKEKTTIIKEGSEKRDELIFRFHYKGSDSKLSVKTSGKGSPILMKEMSTGEEVLVEENELDNLEEHVISLFEKAVKLNRLKQLVNPNTPHLVNYCEMPKVSLSKEAIKTIKSFLLVFHSPEEIENFTVSKKHELMSAKYYSLLQINSCHFIIDNGRMSTKKAQVHECFKGAEKEQAFSRLLELEKKRLEVKLNEAFGDYGIEYGKSE